MKGIAILLVAGGAAAAFTGGAGSAGQPSDFAHGAGRVEQWNAHASAQFSFTAVGGPEGATGTMKLKFTYDEGSPTEEYTVDVTCLAVVGDRGSLAGTITAVTNPTSGLALGDTLSLALVDNGPPSGDVADVVSARAGNETCDVDAYAADRPIDSGNIEVAHR
jgi:hypothetical protein